jgi:NADH-quinone oxidoreductase subunit C
MSQEQENQAAIEERPVEQYPGIAALIHEHLPAVSFAATETKTDVDLRISPDALLDLARGLKETPALDFDFFNNLTGIDMQEEGLHAKYYFSSYRLKHSVQVTVVTPPGLPNIPSLTGLYAAADWHEREAFEMVGLVFDGHPDLKNLLLDEDVHIHPLLKAHPLVKAEILQGIEDATPGFKF